MGTNYDASPPNRIKNKTNAKETRKEPIPKKQLDLTAKYPRYECIAGARRAERCELMILNKVDRGKVAQK